MPMSGLEADQFNKMEQRVQALEAARNRLEGQISLGKWLVGFSGLSVAATLGMFFYVGYRLGEIDAQNKSIAELRTDSKALAGRLQSWEDKGFKIVHSVFRVGEFVALKDDRLTIAFVKNGKTVRRTFDVEPDITVEKDGKRVELRKLNLPPRTPIRFMTGDDPLDLLAFELVQK